MEQNLLRETFPVGSLACNCTLLGDRASGEAVVVDPGLAVRGGPAHILGRLRALGLRLTQILITHAHIDHVGGALALKKATGAPILLHRADLPLLGMMDAQAGWLRVAPPPVAQPDALLTDGQRIGIAALPGLVLHTPGHTEGSVCLLFPAAGLLLAGDTLFAGTVGRTDLPGGDMGKLLRSLREQLLPLPGSTVVVPGHGAETTIGQEGERNPFLRGLA